MNDSTVSSAVCEILSGCFGGCHPIAILDDDLPGDLDRLIPILFPSYLSPFLFCSVTKANQPFVTDGFDIPSYGSLEEGRDERDQSNGGIDMHL
ncbi:hypothetical protein N7495_006225 [Penicillium taxi]|uniref:uncharacterized protein n=1 Tax=Penicillium taxi TaxID=168475 RepID=UPI002544D51A|nr:uncharacterized protein N7495_006225 [Penicillium taxi]KAJ5894534.1 hypothetical protein N7495_006225 [Penicillium taxi]